MYINKIDKTLSRGIKQLSWKSHGIDLFITECMADVKAADKIMGTLKTNLSKIEDKILSKFMISDMKKSRDTSQYGNEKGLSVKEGDVIYVLRMSNCPSGFWQVFIQYNL